MAIEIKQHLKLSQQLVMTPQLQQAIKLLQLSRMELVDLVRDEMLENPILEDAVEIGQRAGEGSRGPDGDERRRRRRARRRDRDAVVEIRDDKVDTTAEVKARRPLERGGQRVRLGELPRQLRGGRRRCRRTSRTTRSCRRSRRR